MIIITATSLRAKISRGFFAESLRNANHCKIPANKCGITATCKINDDYNNREITAFENFMRILCGITAKCKSLQNTREEMRNDCDMQNE